MADNKKNLDDLNKGAKKLGKTEKERIADLEKQNYLLEKQLEYQSDSFSLSSQYVDSLKETLGLQSKSTTFQNGFLDVNKKINKAILNQKVGVSSIKDINKQILSNEKLIQQSKVTQKDLQKSLLKGEKQKIGYSKGNLTRIQQLHEKLENGLNLTNDQANAIKNEISNREKTLANQIDGLSNQAKQLLFAEKNTQEIEKQNEQRKIELGLAKEIEEKLGVAGSLNKLLGAIPGVGKYASDALADVTEELEAAAEAGEELPSNLKVMGKIVGKTAGNFAKAFGPLTLAIGAIKWFIDALKEADKTAGEMAKHFGMSYGEGLKLSSEMTEVAQKSDDILVTQKGLLESQKKLNEYFGTGAKFSGKIAEEFTSIQKRTGLSDKAMGTFTKMAMKSGKPIKSILKDVHATVLEQNQQNKLSLNVKDIQESIVKVSSAIKLQTKGNVKELVNSVVAAKKLGVTLEQVEQISSSLLDFESSIQAELEAELLLGKEINLEQARSAALRGDNAAVAEEVMKNQAIMNAFETDNVIAQEAAAKAIGMSRSQLADMVMEQQQLGVLQKAYGHDVTSMTDAQTKYNELRASGMSAEEAGLKVGDESLAKQLESASIAEKMEASTERLKSLFSEMAETVLPVIEKIMNKVVGAVTWFVKGLKEGKAGALAVAAALGGLVLGAIIKAVAGVWAGAMVLGPIAGPILAGVLTTGLFATIAYAKSQAKMEDGVIGPGGETVVSGPKGSIQLDKQDSMVVGTDLGGKNKGGGNQTASILREQNAILKQILAKSPVLEMAGDKVGNGVEQESRSIQ